MHGHDFLFSLASNKKYIFTYASKNLRLRFNLRRWTWGWTWARSSHGSQVKPTKIEPSHASAHNGILRPWGTLLFVKGITQPSEGNVKSWPRLSTGSFMKIHNQKGAFFVYRERKRENRGMKMDKVSPGFTEQPVQGFWSSLTDMVQFNLGTGLTVNLSRKILKKFGHRLVCSIGRVQLVLFFKNFVSQSRICPVLSRSNCLG